MSSASANFYDIGSESTYDDDNIYKISSNMCTGEDDCQCPQCEMSQLEDMHMQLHAIAGLQSLSACDHYLTHCLKRPMRDSALQGHKWVWEIWHGNDRRFFQNMRMRKSTLRRLLEDLVKYDRLPTSTGRVNLEESLAIFLLILGQGETYSMVEEQLQRSSEIIHNHFHMVLNAVCKFGAHMITPLDGQLNVDPPELVNNRFAWPFFKGCVGAFDETHIQLRMPDHEKNPWINRKGVCTTNVLAIYDFNMCIIFATVGMEVSMHDSKVLRLSMTDPKKRFPHLPRGKYFLADAGYPLSPGFLTPYRNTRYHLPEFQANRVMGNASEIFNYRRSSLRSVIERSFGVLKRRWRVLIQMANVDVDSQIKIIWACICLHNFIRRYDADDIKELGDIPENDNDLSSRLRENDNSTWIPVSRQDVRGMEMFRDSIRDALASSTMYGLRSVKIHQAPQHLILMNY